MDSHELTVDRFVRQTEKTASEAGWGSTPAGIGIVETFIDDYEALVSERRGELTPKALRVQFAPLSDRLVALSAISCGLGLAAEGSDIPSILALKLGAFLDQERYGYEVSNWDNTFAKLTADTIKKSRRNVQYRKTAFRSLAQKKGFRFEKLSQKDTAKVGAWLLGILLSGPVFVLDEGFLTLTEDALQVSDAVVAQALRAHPVMLPSKEPPAPWVSPTMTINSHHVPLVRSYDKFTQRTIANAIRSGHMDDFMEAVSREQSVGYVINRPILELVKWCYETGVNVEGLPPKDDLPMPTHGDWETMSDPERRLWKIAAATTKGLNRSYLGQRLMLSHDLATAEWLGTDSFYTPCNVDYRGRMYPLPSFNFQRGDAVRAMFKFAEGKPLGEHGLYWLKVHVANCGDFGKVSKRSFDERVQWTEQNILMIWDAAIDPRSNLKWVEADKPFLFVAACQALEEAQRTGMCDLPISFDGSCSGLQHLGAMTRDQGTAELVNLTMSAEPNDVYQVVADEVRSRVEQDSLEGDFQELAKRALDYGIDRKLVKRNVMTFSYSSQKYGMAEQHREDTMQPLKYEVMRGNLPEHPFGDDDGYRASIYLAGVAYDAIERVVKRPADAMRFLREIAMVLGHDGLPVIWHTPLGLPVVLRYPERTTERTYLWLNDKGVKTRTQAIIPTEAPGINKRRAANAIAPGFVHSMDSTHLHMVALSCAGEEINNLAMVHDSFGCLPGDAERVREIIKEQFYRLYKENDVLLDICRETSGQMHSNWYKIPKPPDKGDFKMENVLDAEYAFA